MMLHEFENIIENHLDIYQNWSVEEINGLDEKLSPIELKALLIICVTKYDGHWNDVVRHNFKNCITQLEDLDANAEAEETYNELSQKSMTDVRIPDIYTVKEIRDIKLNKVLDTKK